MAILSSAKKPLSAAPGLVTAGLAPAEPPPVLTDSQRIRITLLRERLGALRRRKEDMLHKVCELDAEEAGIAEIFQKNFPGEEFLPPAVPWEKLNYAEKLTCHFIATRGGVRQVRKVVFNYVLATGDVISGDSWAARLAALKNRGALVKTYHGYFIAPEHAQAAIPVPPPPPEETSWAPLVRKLQAQADKERANWKKLGQGPQNPGHDKRTKTLKSLLS